MCFNNPSPKAIPRRLTVKHLTHYHYDRPIQSSTHLLHLCPVHNAKQRVIKHNLAITPAVDLIEFEDVFGNWATRFDVNEPYSDLTIHAESTVELLDVDAVEFARSPIRPSFPLVWMPWEHKMLHPYLQPMELPETQLKELYDYAMSFIDRNNHDLMASLFAINRAFVTDFQYLPGSTWLDTTPYQVFSTKQGVCQDFANLFICMARLLGIPARYVCGYLFTGNTGNSRTRSDASHAWVQLYIPNIGWKGFDPTNGVLPGTDHIRVAYGRNYCDTAPTSGTLFSPGTETMTVDVEVVESTSCDPMHDLAIRSRTA